MSTLAAPTLSVRDYQDACLHGVFEAFRQDNRTLVVMPTGTGKTVLFWSVVQQFLKNSNRRALILAHREELVYQAVAKGRSFGIDCDVEMAASTAGGGLLGDSPVVVASIQTLNAGRECGKCRHRLELALGEWAEENPPADFPGMALGCEQCLEGRVRRLQKFARSAFGLIVIDEAHHSVASSYQRIIDYFDTPTTKVLGVTATPDRHDEEALGQIYHSVAFEYELPDAISDGWLVPIEQHFVEVEGLDLSNCRKNKDGDMQDKDVSAAMAVLLDEGELHKMVDPTIRLADGRRTLVFAASVAHAEAMCDIFNRHEEGSAEFLHGGTPRELRQATLQRFAKGEIQFLCNCLDEETEILTRDGWRRRPDVSVGDFVLSMNPVTYEAEWVPVLHVTDRLRHESEQMINLVSQRCNFRVTEGHRMLVRCYGADQWRFETAGSVEQTDKRFEIPTAFADYRPPGMKPVLTDSECEFVGLFISDGCMAGGSRGVVIGQSAGNSHNCAEIRRILNDCEFDWKETSRMTERSPHLQISFRIPKGSIGGQLKRRGYDRIESWLVKPGSMDWLSLSLSQFEALLYGLWLGDGKKQYAR